MQPSCAPDVELQAPVGGFPPAKCSDPDRGATTSPPRPTRARAGRMAHICELSEFACGLPGVRSRCPPPTASPCRLAPTREGRSAPPGPTPDQRAAGPLLRGRTPSRGRARGPTPVPASASRSPGRARCPRQAVGRGSHLAASRRPRRPPASCGRGRRGRRARCRP